MSVRARFSLRLDDLDPYRGLYEPVPPQRLPGAEVAEWRRLIDEACQLIAEHLPDFADSMPVGLDSLVPKPPVLFRNPSASTGEAFGSAVVGRPADGAALAATLIHEFQHIVLGGVLHLTRLYDDDPRERIYVPWRDDPRPLERGASRASTPSSASRRSGGRCRRTRLVPARRVRVRALAPADLAHTAGAA